MSQELTVQELYDALGEAIAKGYADEPVKINSPVDLLAHQAFASKDMTTALQWTPCPNGRDSIAKFSDGSVLLVTLDAEKAPAPQ